MNRARPLIHNLPTSSMGSVAACCCTYGFFLLEAEAKGKMKGVWPEWKLYKLKASA